MTNYESEQGGDDLSHLWGVLEQLEGGTLSVADHGALDHLLGRSSEARAVYLEYFELATLLQNASAIRAEEGSLPVLPGSGNRKRIFRISVLAAAAAIALMAWIGAYISVRQSRSAVAAVEVAQGTEWSVDGARQAPDADGAVIEKGSAVRVESGVVALTLKSGVRMVLQGPMNLSFPTMNQPVLKSGWLWVDSGGSDAELRVDTPELRIRDIGTRFGVRVRQDGVAEMHLINGIVEAESKRTKKKVVLGPEAKGAMIPAVGETEKRLLARDPFPGLDDFMNRSRSYATTIMSQTPSGYWRLNEEERGELANLVGQGCAGLHGSSARPAAPGVRPEDGFGGFEADNACVFLPGSDRHSVLVGLDAPGGVSTKEGGVSFWFRRDGLPDEEEMLWYAGRRGSGLGPDDEMHAYLGTKGRVRFFMENGKFDILLSSARNVADGQWHHVAASWGESAVGLFLDGRRVAEDTEFRWKSGGVFSGLDVRFGKSRANYIRRFHGWVDEIAYWSRPLTFAEVQQQYQAARQIPEPGGKRQTPEPKG